MIDTIKIRIAVGIDSEGSWDCEGWGGDCGNEKDHRLVRSVEEKFQDTEPTIYWVEAWIKKPVEKVIRGSVEIAQEVS